MRRPRSLLHQRLPWMVVAFLATFAVGVADAFARAGGGGRFGGGGGHGGGGGGGGGGDGGAVVWLVLQLLRLCFRYPLIGIPLLVLFVYAFWKVQSRTRMAYTGGVIREGRVAADRNVTAALLAKLREKDPGFDGAAFALRVQTAFRTSQAAWCSQDLTPIRPFVSDGVFERFSLGIDEERALGYRDQMDGLTVDDVGLVGVEFEGAYEIVTVRIVASAQDYTVSLASGRPVEGVAERESFVETWSFVRRAGARTRTGVGLLEGNCPNCGAQIEGNQFAECKSCGAHLRSGEFDWVLVEVTQAGERATGPQRDIPGVAALQERDPEFSAQALEDRASVAFWRWATAMRSGDARLLAGVARPEVVAQVAAETSVGAAARRYVGECGVGSVEVLGVLSDETTDTAVVEVRWSGTEFEVAPGGSPRRLARTGIRSWLLAFERASGAQSRIADSFASAHCRACGAPASRDAAVCSYCGQPLADVNLGWTLARMTTRNEASGRVLLDRLAGVHGTQAVRAHAGAAPLPAGVLSWAAYVAASDGQIDPRERAAFTLLASRAGIGADQIERILGDAAAGGEPPMPATPEEARGWIEFAARMALADGVVTEAEAALLTRLAGPAHMAAADVRVLLSRIRAQMYQEAREEIRRARAG